MLDHSHAYLSSLLSYDPETGVVVWKVARSNRMREGQVTGTVDKGGYVVVGVDRKYYKAHRLAWFLVYREWPAQIIDHINGEKTDNRLINLRLATQAQNSRNQKAAKNNACGFKGVHWDICRKRWVASIRVDRKLHHLGYFNSKEEAAKAYDAGSTRLHGEWGRSSKAMLNPSKQHEVA